MLDGNNMANNITNDVLAAELRAVAAQVGKLDARLEGFANAYARNDLLELRFQDIDSKLANINLKIVTVEQEVQKRSSRNGFMSWVIGFVGIAIGSAFTYLIIARLGG